MDSLQTEDSKRLQLISLQMGAYENLFMSYINRTTEEADQFNLQNFLLEYSKLFAERQELIQRRCKSTPQ